MLSCEFCEISKNTFFYRTPPVAASVYTKNLRYQLIPSRYNFYQRILQSHWTRGPTKRGSLRSYLPLIIISDQKFKNADWFFAMILLIKESGNLIEWEGHGYIQARKQEFFRAGEFSRNQGTSINISSTTHERKAPQEKIWFFFSWKLLKPHLKWEI